MFWFKKKALDEDVDELISDIYHINCRSIDNKANYEYLKEKIDLLGEISEVNEQMSSELLLSSNMQQDSLIQIQERVDDNEDILKALYEKLELIPVVDPDQDNMLEAVEMDTQDKKRMSKLGYYDWDDPTG